MRLSIILTAALVALGLVCACSPETGSPDNSQHGEHPSGQLIPIRIPDTPFMGYLPIYVAEEQGMLEANGLALQWIDVRDPGQGAKLMAAGKADLILSTFANLVPIEARRPGTLRFLFPASETRSDPSSYMLVRPDSPITSLAHLRGHTVGTYSGPSQKAYAKIVLERLGYQVPGDVRITQVTTSAQVQGLFGGAYDALFTVEPFSSIALEKGARAIATGVRTEIISDPFWLGSAAIPTDVVSSQPTLVPRLLRALDDAVRYIRSHGAESRQVLARRTGTDAAIAERSALYDWVAYPSADQLKEIQAAVDLLYQEKIIEAPVAVSALFAGIDPQRR
jgi:ABC-type nitrate/sulfonate/bicarbonate transport system substrate-binding protein